MADQQHAPAAVAAAPGEEMGTAIDLGRLLDPPGVEAQLVELGLQDLSDGPHAGMVHGAAVDVDETRQEIDRLLVVPVGKGGDGALFGRQGPRPGTLSGDQPQPEDRRGPLRSLLHLRPPGRRPEPSAGRPFVLSSRLFDPAF